MRRQSVGGTAKQTGTLQQAVCRNPRQSQATFIIASPSPSNRSLDWVMHYTVIVSEQCGSASEGLTRRLATITDNSDQGDLYVSEKTACLDLGSE
jgi:hypothetical protein